MSAITAKPAAAALLVSATPAYTDEDAYLEIFEDVKTRASGEGGDDDDKKDEEEKSKSKS
jgi:hypothetical protein